MKNNITFQHAITCEKKGVKLIVGLWTFEVEFDDEDTYRVIGMSFKGNPEYKYDYTPTLICLNDEEVEELVSEELYAYYRGKKSPETTDQLFDIHDMLKGILFPQKLAS